MHMGTITKNDMVIRIAAHAYATSATLLITRTSTALNESSLLRVVLLHALLMMLDRLLHLCTRPIGLQQRGRNLA